MLARIYQSIAQETEFELQSMKKETVGTVELLDQFYRVEVSHQQHAQIEDTETTRQHQINNNWFHYGRFTEHIFAGYVRF